MYPDSDEGGIPPIPGGRIIRGRVTVIVNRLRASVGNLAAAFALGTLVRLVLAGKKSIWHDEASSLIIASLPSFDASLIQSLLTHFGAPLFPVVLRFWLALGSGDGFVRLLPAIGGIVALWYSLSLARRLLPDRAVLPAAFLVALLPVSIEYSQEVRAYSWLSAFELYASLALWRGMTVPGASWAVHFGSATALAVLAHPAAWIWWGAQAVAIPWSRRPRRTLMLFLAYSIPAIALTAAGLYVSRAAWGARLGTAFQLPAAGEYLRQALLIFWAGHHVGPGATLWLPWAAGALAVAGCAALWSRGRRAETVFLLSQAFLPPAAIYAGIALGLSTQLRYVAASAIPFVLLSASGLLLFGRALGAVVVGILLTLQAEGYYRMHEKPPTLEPTFCLLSKKPAREALNLVRGRFRAGDRIVHVSTASLLPFLWMEPSIPQCYLIANPDLAGSVAHPRVGAPVRIAEALRGARRIWLVSCPWRFSDPPLVPAEFAPALEKSCDAPRRYEFPGLCVYLAEVKKSR